MRKFDVTEYTVKTDKIQNKTNGFKIAFLSDFHSNGYRLSIANLLSAIDNEAPDAVLIGGDMFNKTTRDDVTIAANFIASIAEKYRVFYALGNHEYAVKLYDEEYNRRYTEYKNFLIEKGVFFLEDTLGTLEKNGDKINIYGLNIDSVFYGRKYSPAMGKGLLPKHLGDADERVFNVLLAHKPDYFYNYALWGADLTLSGHVHGGIVRLPKFGGLISPDFHLFPYFDNGMYEYENRKMIIGRGLGTHLFNIRINNRPELLMVKILAN